MLRINFSGHVLIFATVVSVQLAAAKDGASQESLRSPRLSALAKQLTGDGNRDRTTIDKFWQAMRGNGPLVERVVDDPRSRWMTFLWRGDDKTERVNIQGGPATAEAAGWMKRLSNTDLWYRTVRVPDDARFVYFFQVNRPDAQLNGEKNVSAPARPDPLNPRVLATNDASLVELAAAPRQPWLNRCARRAAGQSEQALDPKSNSETGTIDCSVYAAQLPSTGRTLSPPDSFRWRGLSTT